MVSASKKAIGEIDHGGVTLPVFDANDTVLIPPRTGQTGELTKQYKDFLRSLEGRDRFVRYLRVMPGIRGELSDMLSAADQVFQSAARLVGATVVHHYWGLSPLPGVRSGLMYRHPDLPDGYSLAADVEIVDQTRAVSDSEAAAIRYTLGHPFVTETDSLGKVSWNDCGSSQFVANPDGLWLPDIELNMTILWDADVS